MANLLVNQTQWDALSVTEREMIEQVLREASLLKIGDTVVPDSSCPPFDENYTYEPMGNPLRGPCRSLCDAAAASGVALCIAKTAGLSLSVCLQLVEAARQECRRRC